MAHHKILIETEELSIDVSCKTNDIFQDESFDNDADAEEFVDDWVNEINKTGDTCETEWQGYSPSWFKPVNTANV